MLLLPATRGRCPPRCAHAAARSISPVRGSRVSGTPAAPLYIFALRLCFWDSFIPVRAAARSARTGSPLPSTRPSTYPCSPPPLPRGAQRPHLHLRRSDTLFSIIGPVNFFLSCFPLFPPISVLLISSPEELLLNSAVTGESPCRCFLVRRNPRNIEAWKRSDLWSGQEVWYISSWGNPFKEARVSWGEVESHGGKVYPKCCWDCFKLTLTIA